jgi:hypothetical protein
MYRVDRQQEGALGAGPKPPLQICTRPQGDRGQQLLRRCHRARARRKDHECIRSAPEQAQGRTSDHGGNGKGDNGVKEHEALTQAALRSPSNR